ncbi:hypothetical protein Tco_1427351 [Tanacetum coccineum]
MPAQMCRVKSEIEEIAIKAQSVESLLWNGDAVPKKDLGESLKRILNMSAVMIREFNDISLSDWYCRDAQYAVDAVFKKNLSSMSWRCRRGGEE